MCYIFVAVSQMWLCSIDYLYMFIKYFSVLDMIQPVIFGLVSCLNLAYMNSFLHPKAIQILQLGLG